MSYICNLVHFVWGTANRQPLIHKSWRDRLHAYMGGILENKKAKLLAAGGIADHVHVLASLPATVSLEKIAGALKANSSRWIHESVPYSSPAPVRARVRQADAAAYTPERRRPTARNSGRENFGPKRGRSSCGAVAAAR